MQLEGVDAATVEEIGPVLRIGRISGKGRGYFKLQKAIQLQLEDRAEQARQGDVADNLNPQGGSALLHMPQPSVPADCMH